ncbi:MAG: hypothetical protein WBP12_02745 [Candidatus Saccharimonas sp.]
MVTAKRKRLDRIKSWVFAVLLSVSSVLVTAGGVYAAELVSPSLSGPPDGASVNGAQYTQSWTAVEGAVKYQYVSYNDAAATVTRWTEVFTTTSKTNTNIAAATYWWRVRAIDATGAYGAWSPLWKLTVDNTAPNGSFTYSNGGSTPVNSPVTVTLTANEPIQTPAGWTKVDDRTYTLVVSENGGADVTIADLANNTKTLHYSVSGIDMTYPRFNIANGAQIKAANVDVVVTESDIDKVYVDGAEATLNGTGPDYAVGVVGEGSHTVRATDKVGNVSEIGFVLDNTAPGVELDDITSVTVGTPVSVSGRVVADPTITQGEILLNGEPVTDGLIDIVDGGFSFTLSGLAVGSHDVSVRVVDGAGNVGTGTAKVAVVRAITTTTQGTDTSGDVANDGDDEVTPASPTEIQLFTAPLLASQAILGDQTTDTATQKEDQSDIATTGTNQDVKGVTDEKRSSSGGLAWYWWVMIVVGAVALWLLYAAWSRNRRAQNE